MSFLFKLRLLNGPLAGRELALPAGELTLGQGDVDLQVPLAGLVTDRHVVLLVSEQGVFLTSAIACWVAGNAWEDRTAALPLAQVIDLAGQGLLLGTVDSTLPLLPLPPRVVAAGEPTVVTTVNHNRAALLEAARRYGRRRGRLARDRRSSAPPARCGATGAGGASRPSRPSRRSGA